MPRYQLPPTPIGSRALADATPPNKITVEARTLASQLVNDAAYQAKLREEFRRRRVHPTIEALIWTYHLGKPTQSIAVSGSMAFDVQARLEEERRLFASLDIHDLEQLAAESQALVDRAFALARADASPTLAGVSPSPIARVDDVVLSEPTDQSTTSAASDQRDVAGEEPLCQTP
jgi:hypothetical protein